MDILTIARPRALVIDDDERVAQAFARALAEDCATTVCRSGEEGLKRLRDGEVYELVLCDVTMPGLSGPEFFAAAVALDPDLALRIVLVTGGAPPDAADRIAALGARCLPKPLGSEMLTALVTEAKHRLA